MAGGSRANTYPTRNSTADEKYPFLPKKEYDSCQCVSFPFDGPSQFIEASGLLLSQGPGFFFLTKDEKSGSFFLTRIQIRPNGVQVEEKGATALHIAGLQ
jgi:hypothetical protein